jgi:diacylglycerol O-acyltransferase
VIRLPQVDVRDRAQACQCTVNDLLLAAVTTGLRALLRERGACPSGLVLRASVPIGARSGNSGGMIVVPMCGAGNPSGSWQQPRTCRQWA